MKEISIHKDMIGVIYEASLEKFYSESNNKDSHKEELEKELGLLKTKEYKLLDVMLDGKVDNDIYEKKSKSLRLEQMDLEQRIAKNSVNLKKNYLPSNKLKIL